MAEDDGLRRAKTRGRLEAIEGVLWAIDHPQELLQIIIDSTTRDAAFQVLTTPDRGLSPVQANHALELQFSALNATSRQAIRDEVAQLRAELEN